MEQLSESWALIVHGSVGRGVLDTSSRAVTNDAIESETLIVEPAILNSGPKGNTSSNPKPVKIKLANVEDEIKYWKTAIVCFVIGANPPLHVIDGFVKRIWKDLKIDTIGVVDKGVFLVRMNSIDDRDKAYEMNGSCLTTNHL